MRGKAKDACVSRKYFHRRNNHVLPLALPFRTSSPSGNSHSRQPQLGRKWVTNISQDILFSYLIIQTWRLKVTLSRRICQSPTFSSTHGAKGKRKPTQPSPASVCAHRSESTHREDCSSCLSQGVTAAVLGRRANRKKAEHVWPDISQNWRAKEQTRTTHFLGLGLLKHRSHAELWLDKRRDGML